MSDLVLKVEENRNSKTFTFEKMLENVEELKQLDISNEYLAACGIIFTLARFENNIEDALAMLEYINGPEDVSNFDVSFINEQLRQYPYVVRSYFNGANSGNNYQVKEVSLTISENPYSREQEGYVKLWFKSSGADNERGLTLRHKGSTSQWFLFSDSYKGLLSGIKAPIQEDKWA